MKWRADEKQNEEEEWKMPCMVSETSTFSTGLSLGLEVVGRDSVQLLLKPE